VVRCLSASAIAILPTNSSASASSAKRPALLRPAQSGQLEVEAYGEFAPRPLTHPVRGAGRAVRGRFSPRRTARYFQRERDAFSDLVYTQWVTDGLAGNWDPGVNTMYPSYPLDRPQRRQADPPSPLKGGSAPCSRRAARGLVKPRLVALRPSDLRYLK
jgi:hypothetical protein